MFERFTERARKVMSLSRQHAQRLNHDIIGTEHILLGLVEEGGGVAAKALKVLGVDASAMRKEIDRLVPPGTTPTATLGQLPWSPRSKRVLQIAEEEAYRAVADVIGTEHLLLALYMEKEGIAFLAMAHFRITELSLRATMKEILGSDSTRISGTTPPAKLVAIKVWLFRPYEGSSFPTSEIGSLVYNNVRMEVKSVVLVDGIPSERQEAVAASLAKDCEAVAYMIEPVKR